MIRRILLACSLLLTTPIALSRGVSPYLPLNLDPVVEQDIEHLLILADKPVLTRPIAAATVLDALPVACRRDPVLCQRVRRHLARYMRSWGVTNATVEVSSANDTRKTLPNSYGLTSGSDWNASAEGFWQPFDHALLSVGAVAYEGEVVPQGSMVSLGWDRAQLDLGYRAHWFSPFTDSSMLISTQAATMPSVTLSNYVPLTRWGVHYEAFIAGMSESDKILYGDGFTGGRPRLAGLHLSVEPAAGWGLGVNRLLQYGGGDRAGSISDLLHGFFDPSGYDNVDQANGDQLGNQLASITSSMIFPGRVPFEVYLEYAGEDTSDLKNYLLGNSSLSAGINFPRLWNRFGLTVELSEWQNAWYINGVYGDGLVNKGHVIGHWAGDERLRGDAVGAHSGMIRLTWAAPFGGMVDARVRALENESYGVGRYETAYDGTLGYSRSIGLFTVGAEIYAGKDVFGESFSRIGAFVRLNDLAGAAAAPFVDAADAESSWSGDKSAEIFVQAGAAFNSVHIDPDEKTSFDRSNTGAHVAVGARRVVSDRSDLGARLELDQVDGHNLLSVRAIDYRYRFENPLAVSAFLGASRYSLGTPAYGVYFGAGVEWRNVMPGWDVGLDGRFAYKVARDHLLPSDPTSAIRPDSFYTVKSLSLVLTRRF